MNWLTAGAPADTGLTIVAEVTLTSAPAEGVPTDGHVCGVIGIAGIGVDLVDIDRFRALLRRRRSVADRLFTAAERAYSERATDPAARLAARFAAKEATLKALGLGLGGLRMAEIEVVRSNAGQPGLFLHPGAASKAAALGVGGWIVTLSHTDRLAQATVVALSR